VFSPKISFLADLGTLKTVNYFSGIMKYVVLYSISAFLLLGEIGFLLSTTLKIMRRLAKKYLLPKMTII
jgi:hypothetical protein